MIEKNKSLKAYNTFAVDARAAFFATIHSIPELQNVLSAHASLPKFILGGGSNVLFLKDFDGLIIHNKILGIEKIQEDENHVYLKVGAGENWHELVLSCIEKNYAGIENLSLIPGTVGAAPIQNIGAYGVELKDVLHEVETITLTMPEAGAPATTHFSNQQCQLGYRDSIFKHALKNKVVITHVTLRLNKKPIFHLEYGAIKEKLNGKTISIKTVSDAVIQIRQEKLPDPKKIPNAGSFFKNPIVSEKIFLQLQKKFPKIPYFPEENAQYKIPAAWLIEQCGFKGKRFGNVGVHAHQALVLVNYGDGTGDEIKKLSEDIQKTVKEKFDIALMTEVNVV